MDAFGGDDVTQASERYQFLSDFASAENGAGLGAKRRVKPRVRLGEA